MRTTIDLPDDLLRALKARAALRGISMRELIHGLIEHGLRSPSANVSPASTRLHAPPVIVPPLGKPIPAVSRDDLKRIEEEEDEGKHGGSARR